METLTELYTAVMTVRLIGVALMAIVLFRLVRSYKP